MAASSAGASAVPPFGISPTSTAFRLSEKAP
jgi:hypothetical protein